jgi:hypothetical protein
MPTPQLLGVCLLGAISLALFSRDARAVTGAHAQERVDQCRALVDRQFKDRRAAANADAGRRKARIESHYNAREDRCFVLEIVTDTDATGASGLTAPVEIQALWDASEHTQYGWFKAFGPPGVAHTECFLQARACHGKEEWERLIRPYMSE